MSQPSSAPSRPSLRGILSVWVAVIIFGAANSLVQLLTQLGAAHPVDGRNPISFCNVLFVGNLFAFFALSVLYRKQCTSDAVRKLKVSDWAALSALTFFSTILAPSLIFLALERTEVTNVILLGRLEPVVFMALTALILGEKSNRWNLLALLLTFTGVVAALTWQAMGDYHQFGSGELMVISAACISAASSIASKVWLKRIPIGIFMIFRTGMGAIIFFWIAAYLFGFNHFQDVFSPFLLQWMVVYVAIVVVGGQVFWFTGLKACNSITIALASTFLPIIGVGFAVLLLGSTPTSPILLAIGFFLASFAVVSISALKNRQEISQSLPTNPALEDTCGFKGV